ncbi:MAG: hypothetical protein KKA60_10395 [Proteobacteria bacterium]|nr:hypothetical protein [Pseudomonadota bacterium]
MFHEKDGIRAYMRPHPGGASEFWATGFVDAPMDAVGAVLEDVDAFTKWMTDLKSARVVREHDRLNKVVYCRMGLPWPLGDRDMVMGNEAVVDMDHARCLITFSAVTDPAAPEVKKVVRMTQVKGRYELEHMGRDRTLVLFAQCAHPGGNLHPMATEPIAKFYPAKNLAGLRKMATQKKYRDRGAASEDRKLMDEILADPEAVRRVLENRLAERIGDPEAVALALDGPETKRMLSGDFTYADLSAFMAGAMSRLLSGGFAGPVLKDPALEKRLLSNPENLRRVWSRADFLERVLERQTPLPDLLREALG